MQRALTLLVLALLIAPVSFALDANDLPVRNVYDPRTRQNEPIRDYTFWELDALLDHPQFRRWNDLDRVCDAMVMLYGRPGHACPSAIPPAYDPNTVPAHIRAYVAPAGAHVMLTPQQRRVVYVGPPHWAYLPPVPIHHRPHHHWR